MGLMDSPKHWASWGRPTIRKGGFTTSILLKMGWEAHKWCKCIRWGRANIHTHLAPSTSTTLTNKLSGHRNLGCLQRANVYARAEYRLTPRKHWFRIIMRREVEMRTCFIFYSPLHAVLGPLLQSSAWISSYSHKGKQFHSQCTFKFKHSEHVLF